MAVLSFLLFFIALIVGLIIKAVEITAETGSTVARKSSDLARYVKHTWEDASNEVHNL